MFGLGANFACVTCLVLIKRSIRRGGSLGMRSWAAEHEHAVAGPGAPVVLLMKARNESARAVRLHRTSDITRALFKLIRSSALWRALYPVAGTNPKLGKKKERFTSRDKATD